MTSSFVHVFKEGKANKKNSELYARCKKKMSSENLNPHDCSLPFPFHLKCSHSKHTVTRVQFVSVNPSHLNSMAILSRFHGFVKKIFGA